MVDGPAVELGSEVELSLHDMAHGGEAVGRLEGGLAVFVAGGIRGERVRARITERRKRWCRAQLLEVLEASPDRVDPPCPVFDQCGGCQWQHIAVDRQREMKVAILRGQLEHLGGISEPPVEPIDDLGNIDGFGYRNHATLVVDDQGRPCYHRAGSHDLVPIDRCPLLHPLIGEPLESLKDLGGLKSLELRCGVNTGDRLAMVRGEPSAESLRQAALAGISFTEPGQGELHESIAGEDYRVSSKSFFQANSRGAERLVELVLEALDPKAKDVAVELYAGVGLFTVPLARRCSRVHAVEANGAALRDLRRHTRQLPVQVHGSTVQSAMGRLPGKADLILADPPREGLDESTVRWLCERQPRTVVLVACDAAALARDARGLVAGGYRLERVRPIDLFPHTFHIEALAHFTRANTTATV